ncbi:hypothetical protein NT6N_18260 [Oceaniferula spumae]|uniref:Glutamine amidotransferase type-2 domain-containing protein n=1 Tax=Oceaniferula spumae TaxID=2979115 RepID=A0AAT9FLD4_9BACT
MQSTISYQASGTLPRFAWAAKFTPETGHIEVHHGDGVEISPDGTKLVEGAWNGAFSEFGFNQSTVFSGTGMVKKQDELLFCSSTDRISAVFSVHKDGAIYVSNSPLFILQLSGTSFLPLYPYYNSDILAIYRQGLYCLDGTTKLADGYKLHIHPSAIVAVSADGSIDCRSYDAGPEPTDFDDYRNILVDALKELFKNGLDPARHTPLQSASSLSRGYDSSATTVLAKEAGCHKVYSFYDSKSDFPYSDCGNVGAEALGMECHTFDRWAYQKMDRPVEAEFCYLSGGSNTPLVAMEDHLRDHIYVIGSAGAESWNTKLLKHYHQLSSPWSRMVSGVSILEFRLRVGYIAIDPSVIAIRHNQAILKIFSKEEMQEWSVGGKYDRPAARRIAEQGGLPRELFGLKKLGTSHSPLKTRAGFSDRGYSSYSSFTKESHQHCSRIARIYRKTHFAITYFLRYQLTSSGRKYVASTPLARKFPFILNAAPMRMSWDYVFALQWAANALKERYYTHKR